MKDSNKKSTPVFRLNPSLTFGEAPLKKLTSLRPAYKGTIRRRRPVDETGGKTSRKYDSYDDFIVLEDPDGNLFCVVDRNR